MSDPANSILNWVEAISPAVIAGIAAWVAVKIENAILKTRLSAVEDKLDSLKDVLVSLADFRGTLGRTEDRLLLQGKRVDDLTSHMQNIAETVRSLAMERQHAKTRTREDS